MSQQNVEVVRRWVEAHPRPEYDPLEFFDAGDELVLFVCRFKAADRRLGIVFRVRQAKVVEWHPYPSEAAARKAAGLSE